MARFWLCPKCGRHVPVRTSCCWCGFDRGRSNRPVCEVTVGVPEVDRSSQDRLWSIVGILLAVITTWLAALWL